ncbi:MAG: hypothetical protein CFH36_01739, partial [Alphaproteobacteria bacterium MarineAlpha9_Bin6]
MFGVEEDVYPSLWSLKINGQVDTLICQTTWSVPSSSPDPNDQPPNPSGRPAVTAIWLMKYEPGSRGIIGNGPLRLSTATR